MDKALNLSVNLFSTKAIAETSWRRDRHFTWSAEHAKV